MDLGQVGGEGLGMVGDGFNGFNDKINCFFYMVYEDG